MSPAILSLLWFSSSSWGLQLRALWGFLRQLCHDDVSSGFPYHPGTFLDIHILFNFPYVPQHYAGFSYILSNFHGTLMSPGCYLALFDLSQLNRSTLLISLSISSMIFTGTSGLLMVISTFFFKFDWKHFRSSTNVHNHAAKKDFLVKEQFKHSLFFSDNIFKKQICSCLNEFWEQEIVTAFAETYMSSLRLFY